jgi:hypothetical protein
VWADFLGKPVLLFYQSIAVWLGAERGREAAQGGP